MAWPESLPVMRISLAFAIAIILLASSGRAQTLVAERPGLMCVSAAALARLTLPDGSSRALSPQARPGDDAIKQAGGCADFSPGQTFTLLRAKRNTSLVTADLQDGQGPRTFIVPSIDLRAEGPAPAAVPTPPPQAAPAAGSYTRRLASAIEKACPWQGWTAQKLVRSERDPISYVFYTMDRGEQRVAQDEAEANCAYQRGAACVNETVFGVMIRAGHLGEMVHAACTQHAP